MPRIGPLVIFALSCGGGDNDIRAMEDAIADRVTCQAIIRMQKDSEMLRSAVDARIDDIAHLQQRAKLWEQKKVTVARDRGGNFSNADTAMHWATGSARSLCDVMEVLEFRLKDLKNLMHDPDLHAAFSHGDTSGYNCPARFYVSDRPKNEKVRWIAATEKIRSTSRRYVEICEQRFGKQGLAAPSHWGLTAGVEPTAEQLLASPDSNTVRK